MVKRNHIGNYAPVSITVYDRLDHFVRTVEALKKCEDAEKTTLFIFSDGARPGRERIVQDIRDYCTRISGFADVRLVFQTANLFMENMKQADELPVHEFGRVIRMEDDIVVSQGFLAYMNSALDKYKDNSNVLNITGYCPPIEVPNSYAFDTFFLQRTCGWGQAFWADSLPIIYGKLSQARYKRVRGLRNWSHSGPDMRRMALKEVKGSLNAADVRVTFYQVENNLFTVYPRYSFVENIGHDGTGLHCTISNKFENNLIWDKRSNFCFPEKIIIDDVITKNNYRFRTYTFAERLRGRLLRELKRFNIKNRRGI